MTEHTSCTICSVVCTGCNLVLSKLSRPPKTCNIANSSINFSGDALLLKQGATSVME